MIYNKTHTFKKNIQTNTDKNIQTNTDKNIQTNTDKNIQTNKNSDKNIEYLINMEKYRFNECHGGC